MERTYRAGDLIGGRYRLVESLGSGGMGAVWRAHHEQLDIDVAIKQLAMSGTVEEGERRQRVERARREGRTVARLEPHPHVVGVRDLIEEDGLPWLVMDLVPGSSLRGLVRRQGPLSVARTVAIACQLLDALRAIHQQDVLHRDIKPDNVLIKKGRQGDHAVLVDFGIALHTKDQRLTDTGLVIGTPEYLDPERLTDKPLGPGSDLFSLGATLYFALEGRSPFSGKNHPAILHAILYERPLSMRRAGPLAPLITDLLQPDLADRPSVEEALHRADELLQIASAATAQAPDGGAAGRRGTRKEVPPPPTRVDRHGEGGTNGGVGAEGPKRRQPRPLVFDERVPAHLRPALAGWLSHSTQGTLRTQVAAKVRFTAYKGWDGYVDFGKMSDRQLWEATDYVLRVGPNSFSSHSNPRSELRDLLAVAEAPYRVAGNGKRLKPAGSPRNTTGASLLRHVISVERQAGSAGAPGDHDSGDHDSGDYEEAGFFATVAVMTLAAVAGLVGVGVVLTPVLLPLLLGTGHAALVSGDSPGVRVWPTLVAIALDLGGLAAWIYVLDDLFQAEEPFKAGITVFLFTGVTAYACGSAFHGDLSFIDQWGKTVTGWLLHRG